MEISDKIHVYKRPRAPNFNTSEINVLLDLVQKYKHILENKQTDTVTINKKNTAWVKLTNEFNANAVTYSRTMESLQGCYRTQKKKLKKSSSDAKMRISAPTINRSLDSVQESEQNSDVVSKTIEIECPPVLCEDTFNNLVTDIKKENHCNNDISNTEGENSVDPLYTIPDNDSDFMREQQLSLPEKERQQPIEAAFLEVEEFSRKTLKRKIDDFEPPIKNIASSRRKPQEKRNVSSHFVELSQSKIKLVKIQTEIAKLDLQEKTKQSQHNDRIRAIELQIKEMELKELTLRFELRKSNYL